MKRFVAAFALCVSLLVVLSVFLFKPVTAKENTLMVLLSLPAPAPPNPLVRRIGQERDPKFYSKENPPKDDAPIDEILDYWTQQNNTYQRLRYHAEPSQKVKQRIMLLSRLRSDLKLTTTTLCRSRAGRRSRSRTLLPE